MAVTKQQLAQWSREFAAKNPDKVSGAGSTAQSTTTKKSGVTKEQLSQWSREFDKKEAQRQAEQEQNTRDKALQQYTERHISDMGEVDARNDTSLAGSTLARKDLSVADATAPLKRGNGDDRGQWPKQGGAVGAAASGMQAAAQQTLGAATRAQSAFLKGNSTESMQRADAPQAQTEGVNSSVNEAAAQSEKPAVRQFAEVAASDSLTGKTIGLFTPNAENRENRAAFEQAYGVTLPDTAGATRRMLRDIAAQQNVKSEAAPAVQSAELPSEAASVPQTVQDAPAETADAMPETAAPDNVREAAAAAAETDGYENAPLRETLGLRPEAPKTQREAEVQRALEGWRVTDKAAETISKNMPDRVDADRYAAAASPLYRLGRSGAATFAQALELAGSMSGTAADINYILSTDAGRTALEIAYTQGKGERMLYAEKMTELGGALGSESTSGRGEVYAKGTMRQESDPASQIISLNAAATGTDAVLRDVLQNDRNIRAYVDTETARIFFGDSAQDIFGTVLHEDYHWYNALDTEGARTLQEHALEYLAKSSINDLLTDLQTRQRHRSSTMSRALDRMRGNYAGAILTVNPGVAIAQAASLPTAGAVLGADTMAAVLPFVKNFSGKQRAAVEAEIRQHGDALLQYRLRGTKRGEMSSIGAHKNLVAKASEAMPAVTGWITGMDEITVAALWEGAKRYVERHAAEFGEDAAEKGSEAYWEAVNKMYQRVIEETQPNYTTMQRAGIQRSDNEFVKTLTMFTTQRFQNYGILADAVGDYKAQKARYAADQSAENKAEVQRAGQSLRRAAASQAVQTAVFALMKIGADFLLHRWDKEQDENGDVTAASIGKRLFDLYTESAAGNFLYGAEIYSVISNAASGADYDVVSATNISAVNDLFAAFTKTAKLLRTDTGEMSEEELAAHHQKLNKAVLKDIQCGLELYGVPAANIRKVMQAFEGYWEDAQAIGRGEGFSFSSAPSSATGQYDRLYNAIQSGDSEEAAAAMKKLEQMNKTDKVDGELARRLKQYDTDVLAAAEARNAGKTRAEEKARQAVFEKLREGLGVAPATDRAKGKADAARRAQLIDLVNKAVDGKADELLAGSKDGSIYDALLDEVKNGRAKDAQEELDRLMTAGKDKGSIKSKITEAVKEEYLAGSDGDRERLEKKLLALEDADGNPLYEEKNFAQWVKDADKKAEKAKDEKNWWEGVK